MKLSWDKNGWEDYLNWQKEDRKTFKRINNLIKDTLRNPTEGIGKPEKLKYNYKGYYSRRIDEEHRLVYKVLPQEIIIVSCQFHYQ